MPEEEFFAVAKGDNMGNDSSVDVGEKNKGVILEFEKRDPVVLIGKPYSRRGESNIHGVS